MGGAFGQPLKMKARIIGIAPALASGAARSGTEYSPGSLTARLTMGLTLLGAIAAPIVIAFLEERHSLCAIADRDREGAGWAARRRDGDCHFLRFAEDRRDHGIASECVVEHARTRGRRGGVDGC